MAGRQRRKIKEDIERGRDRSKKTLYEKKIDT
jgi:hypothetical protein